MSNTPAHLQSFPGSDLDTYLKESSVPAVVSDNSYSALYIQAFPGTGKTTFYNKWQHAFDISDSDSSKFPKDAFPGNYIEHLRSLENTRKLVFCSSHKSVRDAMRQANLDDVDVLVRTVLVVPHIDCKAEYLERYKQRGSPEAFIKLLDAQWENWLNEIKAEGHPFVELPAGTYIEDILRFDFSSGGLFYIDDTYLPVVF